MNSFPTLLMGLCSIHLSVGGLKKLVWRHICRSMQSFAVNPQRLEKGRVICWWCIHAGKYNNHRNLPADITHSSNDTTGRDPDTTAGGEGIRIRHGASQKIGCHFYIVFTQIEETLYRCSG